MLRNPLEQANAKEPTEQAIAKNFRVANPSGRFVGVTARPVRPALQFSPAAPSPPCFSSPC